MASTYGMLASVSRHYAHRIPFLVKLNHNKSLSYPTEYDQILYTSVEQAFNRGAVAVGACSSDQLRCQIEEISAVFECAHKLVKGKAKTDYTQMLVNGQVVSIY